MTTQSRQPQDGGRAQTLQALASRKGSDGGGDQREDAQRELGVRDATQGQPDHPEVSMGRRLQAQRRQLDQADQDAVRRVPACGYSQKEGKDFKSVFAPLPRRAASQLPHGAHLAAALAAAAPRRATPRRRTGRIAPAVHGAMWSLEALRGRHLAHTASTNALNSRVLRHSRKLLASISVRGAQMWGLKHPLGPHILAQI